jgi:hypothetical protein
MMSDLARLDQLRRHLREYPEYHNQNVFSCGTTACAAGWTVALEHQAQVGMTLYDVIHSRDVTKAYHPHADQWNFYYKSEVDWLDNVEDTDATAGYARMLLDLNEDDARALFYKTAFVADSNNAALELLDALIDREKGELTEGDIWVLEEYELNTEPTEEGN